MSAWVASDRALSPAVIGTNPPGFDDRSSLTYGRQITDGHPPLRQVWSNLDARMQRRIEAEGREEEVQGMLGAAE